MHLHINAHVSQCVLSRRCVRIYILCVCVQPALVGYYGESVGGWVGGKRREGGGEDARHYSCISIILE